MPRDRDFIRQLAQLSYDPFFVIDQERRITHFNEQFAMMLGLSAGQRRKIASTPYQELFDLDDTGQDSITECLKINGNVRVQSVKAKLKDGREVVLDLSALPLRDDGGNLTGVIVLHRDVTDEQRLKEKYRQIKDEHLTERETLLRIIGDRDAELDKFKKKNR